VDTTHTAFCLKRNSDANQEFRRWAAWLGTVSILGATSRGLDLRVMGHCRDTRRQSREGLSDIYCAFCDPGDFLGGRIFGFPRGIRIDPFSLAIGCDFAYRSFCPEKSYPLGPTPVHFKEGKNGN